MTQPKNGSPNGDPDSPTESDESVDPSESDESVDASESGVLHDATEGGGAGNHAASAGSDVLFSSDGTLLGLANGRLFGRGMRSSVIWPDDIEGKVARAAARRAESRRAKEIRQEPGE